MANSEAHLESLFVLIADFLFFIFWVRSKQFLNKVEKLTKKVGRQKKTGGIAENLI